MTRLGAVALLGLTAAALMQPIALGPLRLADSHWINLVWSEQFTALVRHGDLWPRWLPQSHGGLGAPVFYFYGPVAFWLAAAAGLVGLATWPALVAAAGLALWASGVAMYFYLAGTRRPLAGAVLYMALPYHLLDFALRGALAEFTAFAALPLVALGVRRAGEGRPGLLAASYALLICTHLPTALLASIFLLPLLLWEQWRRRPRALRHCVVGLGWGLALAAPYLLPALLLQPAVSLGTMGGTAALRPDAWSPFSNDPALRRGLAFLTLVGGSGGLIAVPHLRRQPWAWFALAIAVLALGFAPPLWRLPLLDRVQFPWRLLSLAEFAAALIFARSTLPAKRLLFLTIPALTMSLTILTAPTGQGGAPSPATLRQHPDVIEYLPPGAGEQSGAWSRRALALAAGPPHSEGWTIERRFAFPAWQVRCGGGIVPSEADPATGLIRHRGANCTIERRYTDPELSGWALALLALAAPFIGRFYRAWSGARRAGPSAPRYRRSAREQPRMQRARSASAYPASLPPA